MNIVAKKLSCIKYWEYRQNEALEIILHHLYSLSLLPGHHRCFLWYLRLLKKTVVFSHFTWERPENIIYVARAQQNWSVNLKPSSPVISSGSHVGAFPGRPGCFTGSQRLSTAPCFLRAAGVTSSEDSLPYWCASCAVPWVTLCSEHLPTCSCSPWLESLQVSSHPVAGCPSRNSLCICIQRACPCLAAPLGADFIF